MSSGYQYILLVVAGMAGVVWGLPAAHRLKRPYDSIAAMGVLTGIILTVIGILLTLLPGFFR